MHTHDEMAEISKVVFDFFYQSGFSQLDDNDDDYAQELTAKLMKLLQPVIAQQLKTLEQKHAQELAEERETIGELLTEKEDIFRSSVGTAGYHNSYGSGYDQGIVEGLRLALESLTTDTKEGVAPQTKEAPHWMDCNCECHGFNEDGEDENCPHCMPELYPDYVVAPQKEEK